MFVHGITWYGYVYNLEFLQTFFSVTFLPCDQFCNVFFIKYYVLDMLHVFLVCVYVVIFCLYVQYTQNKINKFLIIVIFNLK